MSDDPFAPTDSASPGADRAVTWLHDVDDKVNALRKEREEDPDSLTDKLITIAVPTLASLAVGKLLKTVWDKGLDRRRSATGNEDFGTGILMASLFAALSAAVGTVVTRLGDRGSRAYVARKHRRHTTDDR